MSKILGYCKECGTAILDTYNIIPDYKDIYECPKCGYPSNIEDLWDEIPYYILIKEEGK